MIVTSYVFQGGRVRWENLEKMKAAVGKERLVLDLSCRKKENAYYIVTDRWQNFTDVILTPRVLEELSGFCDEFLVHGWMRREKRPVRSWSWCGCWGSGRDAR